MKIKLRLMALAACFFCAASSRAAESTDFIIIDESLRDREITAESQDFILEAAIQPEDTFSEYVELIVPICGDGIKDQWEACDGSDFGGRSCRTEGYVSGNLTCSEDCMEITLQGCSFRVGGGTTLERATPDPEPGSTPTVDEPDPPSEAEATPPSATPTPATPAPTPVSTPSRTPRPEPTPSPALNQAQTVATAPPRATPAPTRTPAPRPSPSPSTPRPTAAASTPTPTPEPTPTQASFAEFGPQQARPPLVTQDGTPLLAGNVGSELDEAFVQAVDSAGNIVWQSEVLPNANGAFIHTPQTELAPGEYDFSVYDITMPNAEAIWQQRVIIQAPDTAGDNRPQDAEADPQTAPIARAVKVLQSRPMANFINTVARATRIPVQIDPERIADTVTHVAVTDADRRTLVSIEGEPVDFGQIESSAGTVITGKTKPFGKVVAYIERQVDDVQTMVAELADKPVVVDPARVPATVSHVALDQPGSPLIPLDRPINLGTIGKRTEETVRIRGKATPNAKVIIYFEKQAPPQQLFDYAASLIYDPELDAYYYEAVADENGVFEIPIPAEMQEGDYVVKTAIVEIDELGDRIILGEDREFAFSLFAAPSAENVAEVNTFQGMMANPSEELAGEYLWVPIGIGVVLIMVFVFGAVQRLVHYHLFGHFDLQHKKRKKPKKPPK